MERPSELFYKIMFLFYVFWGWGKNVEQWERSVQDPRVNSQKRLWEKKKKSFLKN